MRRIAIPIENEERRLGINSAYLDYISDAGYSPRLIPRPRREERFDQECGEAAQECDGLLIPGGRDIDPIYYGEENIRSLQTDILRDDFERAMLQAFLSVRKPVFGICRGFQLLAREFLKRSGASRPLCPADGSLYFCQHLEGHHDTSRLNIPRTQATAFVEINPRLLYGDSAASLSRLAVNSIHHQALLVEAGNIDLDALSIHPGIHLSAWKLDSSQDPQRLVVEGINFSPFFGSPVAGVQWHPEEIGDTRLLHLFAN